MNAPPLWREFEAGNGVLTRSLRAVLLVAGAVFLVAATVMPSNWQQQAGLAAITLVLAMVMHRRSQSRLMTLTLMLLSAYSTARYGWWRVASVVAYLRDPAPDPVPFNAVWTTLLLLAELYAFTVLLLSYLQTAWPLERQPAPLPDDPAEWPDVDVLIPTLHEPLRVVRPTVLAAMNIDWPAEKMHLWLLDDGGREEFRSFAAEIGIGYLAREGRSGAKAGNINAALGHASAPFVAIFDCDQVPTRSFLQMTMGWFLRDAKLAVVQTPHRFYSPDPFERNLRVQAAPGESQFFHGAVQEGNDLWNAASFCGSGAVLRRSALDEAGGMAAETVTEDAHTSLRLQRLGWNTAYIHLPQAAGLAPERLSDHVRQRTRWARGMMQVLRLENPLFVSGLSPAQRLCYFSSMAYFLCALPRLIFLTAPLAYLVFGQNAFPAAWPMLLAFGAPHLALAMVTRSRIHNRYRHSFWGEIYETVMAPYILLPTLYALIAPRRGSFHATEKGNVIQREHYDARIAWPYLLLLALNVLAALFAIARVVSLSSHDPMAAWFIHLRATSAIGPIALNAVWALVNAMVLCVVAGTAREHAQRRTSVRVAVEVPSDVVLPDGTLVQGVTCDLSSGGVRAILHETTLKPSDRIGFILPMLDGSIALRASVVTAEQGEVRAQFDPLGLQEEEALVTLLYSRADQWVGWGDAAEPDRPPRSLVRLMRLAVRGMRQIVGGAGDTPPVTKQRVIASIALAIFLGATWSRAAHAAQIIPASSAVKTASQPSANVTPPPDLAMLPSPFAGPGPVTFVFLAPPSRKALEAAGIVASWLGTQGAPKIAVSIGAVPSGNAIVFAEDGDRMPPALQMQGAVLPAVALRTNPSDPASSALVLAGSDGDALVKAALGTVLQAGTWQGTQVEIQKVERPAPRLADDAPRWLPTDRAATFAQARTASTGDSLETDGRTPVRVTLLLPPDLNYEDRRNLALHLDYRYNPVAVGAGSTLNVLVNGMYIGSTPMPHTDRASEVLETVVPVPVADLRPFANTFTFEFAFHPAPGASSGSAGSNLRGAVLKDSSLDLDAIAHWTQLPDLGRLANGGYPFTRRADLADTAVVLPDVPTSGEVAVFLAWMARFGAQTGLPAMNVSVHDVTDANPGKDLLVIGMAQDPSRLPMAGALPIAVESAGLQVRDAAGLFGGAGQGLAGLWQRWRDGDQVRQRFGSVESRGDLPDALLQAVEWPAGSGHTAVVVTLGSENGANNLAAALSTPAADDIAQTVAVLHGGHFVSYGFGGNSYWTGAVTPVQRALFSLQQMAWLVAIVTVTLCFLFAALVQARLRKRARARLQGIAV